MAERPVRIITKRTAVPGKIPTGTTGTELNLIKSGELASNLADKKLFSFDGSNVFEFGTNSFLGLTGGTIAGDLNVTGTISATTYYNLPTISGDYLPLSGGVVTGETIFQNGLTANTLFVGGLTQTSGVTSTGGIIFPQKTINSTYTAQTEDYTIDASGGTFTVYLPTAVGIQGKLYNIKNNAGGAVTVQPFGSETIDDKPFIILGETNAIQLVSNGSNWNALGYNISTVNSSTGVFEFSGLTTASTTTFYVSPVKGWIVDDTTNPLSPQIYYISYTGGTHTDNYVNTDTETFVYLTSASTISQQAIPLTEQQRRQNIFLGKLSHPDKTSINLVFSQPDFVLSPLAQLRDMFVPINLINGGILPSTNGANLKFNTSAGYLYGLGINFSNNTLNPNAIYISGASPRTFQYRTQTGGTATNTSDIDPLFYDVSGVKTAIVGTKATNQRIYLLQDGSVRVMYGQTTYNTLALAIEALQTESFTPFPNFTNDAVLIGVLSVLSTATDLTDTTKARFFFASKFGETVGAAGGTSTTNLQQAYNNSSTPEITTNSTQGGVEIKGGTGNDDDKNIIIESNSGTQTAWITASGDSRFRSANVDYVDFNTTATTTTQFGRVNWDSGTGTLNIGVGDSTTGLIDFQVGQEEVVRIYNSEATTLQKGEIVYVSGSQGNRPSVKRASAVSDGYSVTTLGMVDLAIPSGAEGYVTTFGIISNLNTSGLTGGTAIWLSPTTPGAYTSTKPIAPQHTVLIGYVVRVSATVGSIFVNISNGWELDEIHDVRISGATEGDLLVRSSYSGTPVWVNSKTLNGNYTINGNLNVTGTTTTKDLNVTNNVNVSGAVTSQFISANNITSLSGNVTEFVVTDLDVNGSMDIFGPLTSNDTIIANTFTGATFSGGTFYGDGSQLIGVADIYVTGGTYDSNTETITFYQNSGGTFVVTGITKERYVTGGTINTSGNTIFSNNLGEQFVVSGTSGYGAGVIQGSSGWTQAFNGTITLPTVNVALYDNPSFISPLKTYRVTGGTSGTQFSALVDNSTNYIYVDYNGGSPVYNISTTDSTNGSDKVRVLTVYRLGNFVHVLDFGDQGSGTSNRIINRIISTERFARESGLALGVSGTTGIVTLTTGVAWNGINRQDLSGVNSQDDIFFQNYHIGGVWTATTSADTFNNLYYDDGTDKVSATTGNYIVNWYFRGQEINDHLYEVWGNSDYATIDDAQASTQPPLPDLVTSHAFLVGRLIIEAGTTSGVTVESAFTQQFSAGQVSIHNNLSGLQGGTTNQYYHLTQTEYENNAYTNVDNNFSTGQTINGVMSATSVESTSLIVTNATATTISNVDYVDLNTQYTGASSEGRLSWDFTDGTLRVGMGGGNVNQQVGLEQYYIVSNVSGATINEGYVVRAADTDPINERIIGDLMIADGTIPSKFTLGIATENISSGNTGYITSFGVVRGIDATGSLFGESWNNGDILYVSTTTFGGLTNVEPQSPSLKIEIAIVLDNTATGSFFVRPNILPRIEDLTDVQTTGATTGDILVYNSSNNLWEHSTALTAPGYTITGNTNVNVLTANTINSLSITGVTYNIQSPTQDDTLDDFLVIDNDGNFFTRNFNSVNYIPNVVTVSLSGGSSDFTSIKSAVDSITAATSTNPWLVKVGPGTYNEDPITTKPFVAIVGESSVTTIVNANDPNQSLFLTSDNSFISDLLIQGCTGTSVSAVLYSSSTTSASSAIVYIENVRFGANYTHVRNNPYGGGNTAIQCTNIKYGAQPFTLGFYMTSDGASTGRFQLRNVTTTAGGVANTTGLTFAKVDQPNCTIIGNLVTVTKAGSAPVSGIGFQVENGGLLRLNGFNIQRFGTGIYAPQVGSAPTIDAVGLNFENCTTDVDIIHSGATGKVNGTDTFLKTKINIDAPLYEVNQDPRNIVVAKKGGDFSSVKSAVDYLIASGNTSEANRFIISVGPGEFTEDEIDLTSTPYVSIVGSNIQTTLIKPSTPNQHILKIGINNEVSFLTLSGVGVGYSAIYCDDIGDFAQAHKVSIYDCDTNVWVISSTQDTTFYGEYLDFNGEYSYGARVEANNGFQAYANLENYYQFPSSTGSTIGNYGFGSGATLNIALGTMDGNGSSGSTAFHILDSANLNLASVDINNWDYGVRNPNVGLGATFEVTATIWSDCINDISIENVNTTGVFQGIASHEKVTTDSEEVYWLFLDPADGELDITRKGSVTFADGTHTDFTTLLFESGTMGLLEGGEITEVSGFTINTETGYGYLESPTTPGVIKRIDWDDSQLTIPSGSSRYVFINENGILSSSGGAPNSENNILLGRVVTDSVGIEFIENSPLLAEHTSNKLSKFNRTALGSVYATGSIVTENQSNPFEIDVTAGEYFFSENEFLPTGGTSIQFTQYYRDGLSGWTTSAATIITNSVYDNNGSLTGLTSSAYTKHTLYVLGDGNSEKYFLVIGQNEYMTLVEAEDAGLPTPPTYFSDAVTPIASIYVRESATAITQIQDVRPVIGFRAAGVNASSVHGNLLGLDADDHTQYLLVSGARAMTGNLNLDGNNIISAGTINGVTIQSHASRHKYNGADEVGTLTPTPFSIPYSDSNSKLDSWISSASTTTLGLTKLSAAPTIASNPIAVGTNDLGYLNSITGITYSANTLTATRVSGGTVTATIGLRIKSNSVAGASFAGNPKVYDVVFTTAYPNTNYSIQITGGVNRTFTYENKTTTGFRINANANLAFTENVDWTTTAYGES